MNNIYKILPVFQRRIWGGTKLKSKFGYQFDLDPVGEAWVVADLPLGCNVVETTGQSLKDFYHHNREQLFKISCANLPIRVTIIDPIDDLSVQLHPSNEYALANANCLGKPEAWYIMEHEPGAVIQFGHHAQTKEEFITKVKNNQWEQLLNYIHAEDEKFLYVDWGVLHAIGKGVLAYEVARNADITYRVYDYNRVDQASNQPRALHLDQALDNLRVPFNGKGLIKPAATYQDGCEIIEYFNQPGEFIFRRIRVIDNGAYHQPEFGFYTVGKGKGKINNHQVKIGDTIFVPCGTPLQLEGNMDLLMASYRD